MHLVVCNLRMRKLDDSPMLLQWDGVLTYSEWLPGQDPVGPTLPAAILRHNNHNCWTWAQFLNIVAIGPSGPCSLRYGFYNKHQQHKPSNKIHNTTVVGLGMSAI
jgi:hypothetical protein